LHARLEVDLLDRPLRGRRDPDRLARLGAGEGVLEQALASEELALEGAAEAPAHVRFHGDAGVAGDHRPGLRHDLLSRLVELHADDGEIGIVTNVGLHDGSSQRCTGGSSAPTVDPYSAALRLWM